MNFRVHRPSNLIALVLVLVIGFLIFLFLGPFSKTFVDQTQGIKTVQGDTSLDIQPIETSTPIPTPPPAPDKKK